MPTGIDAEEEVLVELGSVTAQERDLLLRGLENVKRQLLEEALAFAQKKLTYSVLEEVNKKGAECLVQAKLADKMLERWTKKTKASKG